METFNLAHNDIVIVDDEPENLKVLQAILEDEGYRVRGTTNGELALISAASQPPDLFLLDIRMPGLDGFQLCEKIKENDTLQGIPVIFVSALTDIEDKIRGFKAGGIDYVTKPYEREEIINRVNTHIKLYNYEKKLKQDVVASEHRLRQVAENMPVMMLAFDDSFNVIVWNRESERVTGYNKTEMVHKPKNLKRLFPDENYRKEVFKDLMSINLNFRNKEYELINKSGFRKTISWSNISGEFPIPGWHAWVIGIDITERKRHERIMVNLFRLSQIAVTHSKDYLLKVFLDQAEVLTKSCIGFFYFISSDEDRVSLQMWSANTLDRFNKAGGQSAHYPVDNGGVWLDCVRERKTVVHNDFMNLPLSKGMPEGHAKVVREMLTPIIRDEKVVAVVGVGNKENDYNEDDIRLLTEMSDLAWEIIGRKKAEEEQAELRTHLQQVQKMEAIGTLAGGIAHDFNNILQSIMAYASLMRDIVPEKSEFENYLDQIMIGAKRAKELVKQILTFSRQTDAKKEAIDIVPLIKESLKFLKASLPATINIEQNISVMSGIILADPTQFHQVLMNLCTNAGYAMDKKGGVLKVDLEEIDIEVPPPEIHNLTKGTYLKMSVSDTGYGIPPETISRIFEPFFTTKPQGEGTGLGLSVIHGIIKDCQGAIRVQSEVGNGSLFEVFFPKLEESEMEGKTEPEIISGGNEHVLVVEDDIDLLKLVSKMLNSLGYKVTGVTKSIEAKKLFIDNPNMFDLVLTDQTMPELTGIELGRIIREIRPGTPLVMMTGFNKLISEENTKELGFSHFLTKPFNRTDLARAIRSAMG